MFSNILDCFYKRKVLYFFIILQLIFCFISLNESYAVVDYYNKNIKAINKIITSQNTYILDRTPGSDGKNFNGLDSKEANDFYQFLSNDVEIHVKGGYLYLPNNEGVNILGIDKDFLSYDSFDICEGRKFTIEDFGKKELLPIILGYDLKANYKIDDIIKVNNKNYTVIGFLKKDSMFLQEGNIFIDKLSNLNNFFLTPVFFDELDGTQKYSFMKSYLFDIENDADVKTQQINDKMNELSLVYKVKAFKSVTDSFYDNTKGFVKVKIVNSFLLLLITISGIISTAMLSIMNRKREFGILMALGASKRSIIVQVILENVITAIIAFIASLIHFVIKGKHLFGGIITATVSISNIGVTFGILFLGILIISLCVLLKMLKFSLKDLIGGVQ